MFRRSSIFKILFIVIVIAVVLYSATFASKEVSNKVTIATALLGFIAIIYQLYKDSRIKKAEFLFELNDKFNSDERIMISYELLKKNRKLKIDFSKDEISNMGNYIMFFIILNYLVNKGQVSIKMVDKIFANKFFLLCHNEAVQKQQFSTKEVDINYPIMELYETWYNYRQINGLNVLYNKQNVYAKHSKIFTPKNGLISFKCRKKRKFVFYWNRLFKKVNTEKSFK
ncbi:hypothetical protein KQ51_01693 [Candidatus Izimaplasma bacterium HR1]|uniref:hypothetical protein n=1 Tax=Candidatus Izimoplasma sp. HR1 TaxID=1541959 RepID=UPI0004F6CC13|nr:hypothetical protein KQ51_01693 [Candidatus Izimaplasma bacterium HR1]